MTIPVDLTKKVGPPTEVIGMPQAAMTIERFVKERHQTDEKLVSWPLYFFLLTWITLFIYPMIMFYKRVQRADNFRQRKANYYGGIIEYSTQFAQESGNYDAVYSQINDMHESVNRKFADDLKPINPGMSLVLTIVTFGLYGFYVLYRNDKFWWEIQEFERDFDDSVSQLWTKLGILKYPVRFEPRQSTKRSFGLYLGVTLVTFGLFGIVWDYKVHTDPEALFPEFHSVEDAVLNAVRTASPQV
jgi:hypothetical protein